jgi:hypothetical protein
MVQNDLDAILVNLIDAGLFSPAGYNHDKPEYKAEELFHGLLPFFNDRARNRSGSFCPSSLLVVFNTFLCTIRISI